MRSPFFKEQRNVTQAQTDEIAALVPQASAMVDCNHAVGTILKKNNIVLDNNNQRTLGSYS
jgi:hypothetical protein